MMPADCFASSMLPQSGEHSQSAEMLALQAFRYLLMFLRVPSSCNDPCKHDRHMSLAPCCIILHRCKTFFKVCDDIIDMLRSDGETDGVSSDALICQLLITKL